MDYSEIGKFISVIIIGFLSAYFGSLFALNKFKKEKFWNERRNTYKNIVEAFEELLHWAEQVRAEHCCEPSSAIEAKYEIALREISRYSETGGIIFSQEFYDITKEANKLIVQSIYKIHEQSLGESDTEQERSEWCFIQANEIGDIVNKYLPKLIEIARDELPKKI
ncbi:MAG TPA: hypothetical protein ENI65_07890 [Gammaproteobacteria bacterium]|nr:hypothetical protein [Gammaproteobacteria bacterium]